MRTWKAIIKNNGGYTEVARFKAQHPNSAVRKFCDALSGCDVKYVRSIYGYITGRIEIRFPETAAATDKYRLPADCILSVVKK